MSRTAAVSFALITLSACGADSDPTRAPQRASATRQTAAAAPLGAATWLPADVAWFSSVQGAGQLMRDIGNSEVFQSLRRLPMFTRLFVEYELATAMRDRARRSEPILHELLSIAEQGFDREIFAAAGPATPLFVSTLAGAFSSAIAAQLGAQLSGQRASELAPLVDAVLANADELRIPELTIGLRVADERMARVLVRRLAGMAAGLPGSVDERRIGGGEYHVWSLGMQELPPWQSSLRRALARSSIADTDAERFVAWCAERRLAICAGVRDGYVVFSVAEGTAHLEQFGGGSALADHSVFERLRDEPGAPLLLTYVSPEMRRPVRFDIDAMVELALRTVPAAPGGASPLPRQAFARDLERLLKELVADQPDPVPFLQATYRDRGLSTLTLGAAHDGASSDRPLAVLRHAGEQPLVAVASRAAPLQERYERISHWTKAMFGHFEALAVPRMSSAERRDFAEFRELMVPTIRELDEIAREVLLPAADAGEGLFLLDEPMVLRDLPGLPRDMPMQLMVPRPALVFRVRDAKGVVRACERARTSIDAMLGRIAEHGGLDADRIPVPDREEVAEGTLYSWRVPGLPAEVHPSALVTDDTIVLALSPQHARKVLATEVAPSSALVDFTAGASANTSIDLAGLCALLRHDSEVVLRAMSQMQAMPAGQARAVFEHIGGALRVLATMRRFQSRSWNEGGMQVQRSWLHVEEHR